VLARVDSALMRAESAGVLIAETDGASLPIPVPGEGAWKALLEGALACHEFSLVGYPVLAVDGSLVHREFMLRLPMQGGAGTLTAGQFMPAAVRLAWHRPATLKRFVLVLRNCWIRRNRLPSTWHPVR